MSELTRRTAIFAALGAGVWATGALAQPKDLQVEEAPVHHPHHHPRPHPAPPPPETGPVQVSLTPVGPSTLSIGEPIRFKMVSLANSYGHLYVFSASGRSQLWMENVRLYAGVPLYYPRPGQIVRAAPPAGDEIVMFVATRARIPGFLGGGSTSMTPVDLQYTHDAARDALQTQLNSVSRDDWAVAEVTIRVQE